MSFTTRDLKRIAAAAWGSSNPVQELRAFEERIQREIKSRGLEIEEAEERVRSFLRFLPGILEAPDDSNRARVFPDFPLSMDVDVLGATYMLDGRPQISDGGKVPIPRPGDGVTREFLGIVLDTNEFSVFQTGGEIKPSPVVERKNPFEPFETLTEGVDYTVDLNAGTITTVLTSEKIKNGDAIHLTGAWVGEWTVSVFYGQDGSIGVQRGNTFNPLISPVDASQGSFDIVQVSAVGPVSDLTTQITNDLIQNDKAYFFGVQGILKFFSTDPDIGHGHRGLPQDGPQLGFDALNEDAKRKIDARVWAIAHTIGN